MKTEYHGMNAQNDDLYGNGSTGLPKFRVRRWVLTCIPLIVVFFSMATNHWQPFDRVLAHTPTTTKFDFREDVLPILEKRCNSCHGEDPAAPMKLTTHQSVRPWGVSIKEQLLQNSMPPWFVEQSSWKLENEGQLSASELNTILDWSSGGAPRPKDKTKQTRTRPAPSVITATHRIRLGSILLRDEREEGQLDVAWSFDRETIVGWSVTTEQRDSLRSVRVRVGDVELGTWTAGEDWIRFPKDHGLVVAPETPVSISWSYKKPWHKAQEYPFDKPRLLLLTETDAPKRHLASAASKTGTLQLPPGAQLLSLSPRGEAESEVTIRAGQADAASALLLSRVTADWPISYRLVKPSAVQQLSWNGSIELSALYSLEP